jgi:hypothetical protein
MQRAVHLDDNSEVVYQRTKSLPRLGMRSELPISLGTQSILTHSCRLVTGGDPCHWLSGSGDDVHTDANSAIQETSKEQAKEPILLPPCGDTQLSRCFRKAEYCNAAQLWPVAM